jgi:gluconokinase
MIRNRKSAIQNRKSKMVLVLDLGSSSTRAMLYDDQANAVPDAMARVKFDFVASEDGRSEDDADAAFERVVQALDELHAFAEQRGITSVTRIGISAYASSLVCLDENRLPITPVYTYADTRCAADARTLRAQHDELDALQRTGCRIRANYLPARITWLRRTDPDAFAKTRWFVSLSDVVMLRLTGRMSAGISIASWTGLLNKAASNWDETWIAALGISKEQLPEISPSLDLSQKAQSDGVRALTLLPAWQTRWPRFKDAVCHPPVGDGAAANVGSGCIDPSRIAVTIGSTAAMRVVASIENRKSKIVNPALWSYRVDHDHDLIGGATTEGGNAMAWARSVLRVPDAATLETAIADMQPDAHGLTVLPTFAGERSPGYAEDIRATLHGLSLDTSPVEIVRALMEGIAMRLATICDALRDSGIANKDAVLVASGGALQASPAWCQIIADAAGVPLEVADMPEATSRGAALLAMGDWRSGGRKLANSALANRQSLTYHPNSQHHSIYRAALARQQELYAKLVRSDR